MQHVTEMWAPSSIPHDHTISPVTLCCTMSTPICITLLVSAGPADLNATAWNMGCYRGWTPLFFFEREDPSVHWLNSEKTLLLRSKIMSQSLRLDNYDAMSGFRSPLNSIAWALCCNCNLDVGFMMEMLDLNRIYMKLNIYTIQFSNS
jgi:hypothetical protein